MAHTGTFAAKLPNYKFPKDYLDRVIAANPTCFGYAVKVPGGVILERADEPGSADVLLDSEFDDKFMMVYFGNFDAGYKTDDIQPFPIIVDNDGPVVSAFIEGDYDFSEEDNGHSHAFSLCNDSLSEKLKGIYDMVGEDLTKFKDALKSKVIKKEITGLSKEYGIITLMFGDGDIQTFANPEGVITHFPQDGFWTTDTHGYVPAAKAEPAKVEEKPVVEEKKLSGLDKIKALKAKLPVTVPSVKLPAEVIKPEATATAIPPDTATKVEKVNFLDPAGEDKLWRFKSIQAPEQMKDPKKLSKFYRQQCGFEVPNANEHPIIKSKIQRELIRPSDETLGVHKTEATAKPLNEPTVLKTSGMEVRKAHNDFLSTVDKNSNRITDPTMLQEKETKSPTFIQISNFDSLEQTYNWSMATRVKHCKDFPEYSALLMRDLTLSLAEARSALSRTKASLDKLENKQEDKQSAPTAPPVSRAESPVEKIARIRKEAAEKKLAKAM